MTYVILTLSISPLREGKIFCSELGFATSDKASWSERIRAQFRDSKNMRKIPWSIRKYSESLFHVLKLHNLPPLFSNFIFLSASKCARTRLIRSLCCEKHFAETGLFI